MTSLLRAAAALLVAVVGTALIGAQDEVAVDGRPSRILANDKLGLTVRSLGGVFAQVFIKDDPDQLNPL